jgi:hypothetical protein
MEMKTGEACRRLKVTKVTLRRMVKRGDLLSVKHGVVEVPEGLLVERGAGVSAEVGEVVAELVAPKFEEQAPSAMASVGRVKAEQMVKRAEWQTRKRGCLTNAEMDELVRGMELGRARELLPGEWVEDERKPDESGNKGIDFRGIQADGCGLVNSWSLRDVPRGENAYEWLFRRRAVLVERGWVTE